MSYMEFAGFYRTLYKTSVLKLILDQLKADHTVIDGLTKSQLISDYFTFADEGMTHSVASVRSLLMEVSF